MTFTSGLTENISVPATAAKKGSKEKIFFHAAKLFAQKGYHGTSVRDIAKAARVNVALINYHFKSKENLYTQVITSGLKQLNDVTESVKGQSVDKIITAFYNSAINLDGPAYFFSVLFTVLSGGFDRPKSLSNALFQEPTELELTLKEAVKEQVGSEMIEAEISKISHYLIIMLTRITQLRFGLGLNFKKSYTRTFFTKDDDPSLAMIKDISKRLCRRHSLNNE